MQEQNLNISQEEGQFGPEDKIPENIVIKCRNNSIKYVKKI